MKPLLSTLLALCIICITASAQDSQIDKSSPKMDSNEVLAKRTGDTKVDSKKGTPDVASVNSQQVAPAPEVEKNNTIVVKKRVGPNGEETFRKGGRYYYIGKDGKTVEMENSDVTGAKGQ